MIFPPILKLMVGFLHVYVNHRYEALGTCFFIAITEQDFAFQYVVTSKHVVEPAVNNNLPVYVRLNRTDKPDVDYLRITSQWVYHNDKRVDVAIASFSGDPDNHNPLEYSSYSVEALITPDILLAPMEEGIDVAFIGLFAQYHGYKRNFPVIRQGKLALVTDEPVMGVYGESLYHFIECDAYPGHSGSPVFSPMGTSDDQLVFGILGIVSSFYPHQQQLFVENNELKVYSHFGISLVTPARYVKEVLYQEEFVKQRKDRIGAENIKNAPKPAALATLKEPKQFVFTRKDFVEALRKVSRPNKSTDDK